MKKEYIQLSFLIILSFSILYFISIPLIQRLSLKIQGTRFNFRTRLDYPSSTKDKYDLLWSFIAFVIAMIISIVIFDFLNKKGWLPGA